MDDRLRDRVLKELATLRKASGDLTDGIRQLSEVVADGTPSTRALVLEFITVWERRHAGEVYDVHWARDMSTMKRLLKKAAPAEIRERMGHYFEPRDPWYEGQGHPLTLFASRFHLFKRAAMPTSGPGTGSQLLAERGYYEPER